MREVAPVLCDHGRAVDLSDWPGSHLGGFLPFFARGANKAALEAMLACLRGGWSPTGRPTTPVDVGGAVAALCSDDAAWITGRVIVVDGGAPLMNPEVPLDFQRP